ncbi:hypothetical protein ACHIPZ_13620 [Antrihabitans sp. NCIMB 15449]|uniref:DUF222 domain-containing protein n=1 Tax=Antrihabitans spumae TaxID=3373370 RepID=A0ABW7JPY7_9NOCA
MTIEHDVIEPRRRERNAARSPEVLPPDVDTKVSALRRLDSPEARIAAVTVMLNHARSGLLAAIAAHDLPEIVNYKAKASAIHEISKQLRLGKEMQLDAAEFVRRAERGLGVAIREGQARGEVETRSEGAARGPLIRDHRVDSSMIKPKPSDFAAKAELSGNGGGIYAMTDNVTDEQFEEALADAKAEENLSRANVARKAKAKAAAPETDTEPAPPSAVDEPPRRTRGKAKEKPEPIAPIAGKRKNDLKASPTELLENIEGMLAAIVQTCKYIDPAGVERAQREPLTHRVFEHLGFIRRSMKEIRNV